MTCCPICVETIDAHDRRFFPCPCGFQVCFWCYRKIKDTASVCPKCRAPYIDENLKFGSEEPELCALSSSDSEDAGGSSGGSSASSASSARCSSKSTTSSSVVPHRRPPEPASRLKRGASSRDSALATTAKALGLDVVPGPLRKSILRDVRVVRRDLCYLVGLPLDSVVDEAMLKSFEFFGKYGRVVNIIVNRNPNFKSPDKKKSCAVYITFSAHAEAKLAIQDIDESNYQGRKLRASYGTTKYCSNYLRNQKCNNKTCFYLHQKGADEDSFTVDQLNLVKENSKDLTCSAILSHELTDSARLCPVGTSLFGKTREEVIEIYINLLKQQQEASSSHQSPETTVPESAAAHLATTTTTHGSGEASPSVKYASLRQHFSALKRTADPPAEALPPPSSGGRSHAIQCSYTILPSVKEELSTLCKSLAAPNRSTRDICVRGPTVEVSAVHATDGAPAVAPHLVRPTVSCPLTVHPALQKEWGWNVLETCAYAPPDLTDWSLKALASPLHPKDGLVAPPKVCHGPSRLIKQQCVTLADLTATYNVPGVSVTADTQWLTPVSTTAGPPPGLY